MPFSPFTCRQRGEPDPKWFEQDPHTPLTKREHQLFAESCARIDARNRGLAEIASILRETREGLASDNVRTEGGVA